MLLDVLPDAVLLDPDATSLLALGQGSTHQNRASTSGLTILGSVRLDDREGLLDRLSVPRPQRDRISDPALILLAYQAWGSECVERLLGDFAFAIWDLAEQRLFCARDHIGCRPFHYHLSADRMIFAAQLEAILSSPGVSQAPDDAVLAARLCGDQPALDRTEYLAVRRLPPGHAMLVDRDGSKIWRYWQPADATEVRYPSESDYVARLNELLDQAIACRMDADTGVGAHLSGGLDSSGIGVLAARKMRAMGKSLETFAWSPPIADGEALEEQDERGLIQKLLSQEGLSHHPIRLTSDHLVDWARLLLQPYGAPSSDFPQEQLVRRQARALGIGVLLSGWGGDEFVTFNGRGVFAHWLRAGQWVRLFRELHLRKGLHDTGIWSGFLGEAVLPQLPNWMVPWLPANRLQMELDPKPRLPSLLDAGFAARMHAPGRFPQNRFRQRPGVRVNQLELLALGHLTERIEAWALEEPEQGIEYRYPLLDRRLIEFSLGLPPGLSFRNGWKRYLYRTAMTGVLPPAVQWCKVKDDPARIKAYMRLRDELERRVLRPILEELAIGTTPLACLDVAALRRVLRTDSGEPFKPKQVTRCLRAERMLNPKIGEIIDAHIDLAQHNPSS